MSRPSISPTRNRIRSASEASANLGLRERAPLSQTQFSTPRENECAISPSPLTSCCELPKHRNLIFFVYRILPPLLEARMSPTQVRLTVFILLLALATTLSAQPKPR